MGRIRNNSHAKTPLVRRRGLAYVLQKPVVSRRALEFLDAGQCRRNRPFRVWNGIFAAGDRRAKKALEAMSPSRDPRSETTTREKLPQKRPFWSRAVSCGLRTRARTWDPLIKMQRHSRGFLRQPRWLARGSGYESESQAGDGR